jgi:hypothetical protein
LMGIAKWTLHAAFLDLMHETPAMYWDRLWLFWGSLKSSVGKSILCGRCRDAHGLVRYPRTLPSPVREGRLEFQSTWPHGSRTRQTNDRQWTSPFPVI